MKGVIKYYPIAVVPGFDAVIATNVPIGGGLSSSAALEVATATFLEILTNSKMSSKTETALLCQKAEHTFAGVPCGIMDQMISVMGERDHVLLIDCRDNSPQLIPFKSDWLAILIINSNVKHDLTTNEYAVRREQCEAALKVMGVHSYREVDARARDECLAKVADELLQRRARHVITESLRTLDAVDALKESDFRRLGALMNESHRSLDEDFDVACPETNKLVEITRRCDGVYGSRQTGGGFGGCTVTLIDKGKVEAAVKQIGPEYKRATGYDADFYVCEPSDGARAL